MSSLVLSNIPVRQDKELRYCLNDLHKASGGEQKHQPANWLRNQQTIDLISFLKSEESAKKTDPISVKQGVGTFVVKELVYAYAMWISSKFHITVIRAYDSLFTEPKSSEPKTKKAIPGGLTKSHQDEVKTLVRQRADALPENKRAKATISMWSAIKKKWGCTYKEVPDEDFSSVIGLVARMPLDGEVIPKGETVLITSTEFDYAHAKGHADNLRHMARATVDDLLADEFIEEINRLEKCLTRAWTEMDEALFRMSHAVTFLKRWRSK